LEKAIQAGLNEGHHGTPARLGANTQENAIWTEAAIRYRRSARRSTTKLRKESNEQQLDKLARRGSNPRAGPRWIEQDKSAQCCEGSGIRRQSETERRLRRFARGPKANQDIEEMYRKHEEEIAQ